MTQNVNAQNSNYPTFLSSFTLYIATKTVGNLHTEENDGKAKMIAKLTANTTITTILVLASLVETVVRTAFLLVAKLVQFLIPKQWTEKFDEKILAPLAKHVKMNLKGTAAIGVNIVYNFKSAKSQISMHSKLFDGIDRVANSNFVNGLYNLHFNGFRALVQ